MLDFLWVQHVLEKNPQLLCCNSSLVMHGCKGWCPKGCAGWQWPGRLTLPIKGSCWACSDQPVLLVLCPKSGTFYPSVGKFFHLTAVHLFPAIFTCAQTTTQHCLQESCDKISHPQSPIKLRPLAGKIWKTCFFKASFWESREKDDSTELLGTLWKDQLWFVECWALQI